MVKDATHTHTHKIFSTLNIMVCIWIWWRASNYHVFPSKKNPVWSSDQIVRCLVLYFIFTVLLSIFTHNRWLFFISFGIYYVLIPLIRGNATIGMRFLNVKMEFIRLGLLFNTLRYFFLYLYYFALPLGFIMLISYIRSYYNLQGITFLLYGGGLLVIFLFYLIHFILLLKNKKMYYDKLFGVRFVSTISFFYGEN